MLWLGRDYVAVVVRPIAGAYLEVFLHLMGQHRMNVNVCVTTRESTGHRRRVTGHQRDTSGARSAEQQQEQEEQEEQDTCV